VFSSLRASRRDVEFLKIFRGSAYFGHLVTMWSIERFSLHVLHTGAGSLVMRKEWVRCVWPILARVIMTSSLILRLQGKLIIILCYWIDHSTVLNIIGSFRDTICTCFLRTKYLHNIILRIIDNQIEFSVFSWYKSYPIKWTL